MISEKLIIDSSGSKNLSVNDIILCEVKMNYAMKDQNPVDNVHCFTRWNISRIYIVCILLYLTFKYKKNYKLESFVIQKENVSLLIPDQFSEVYARIYVKDSEKLLPAQEAFRKFLMVINCSPSPAHSLPGISEATNAEPKKDFIPSKKRKIDFDQDS